MPRARVIHPHFPAGQRIIAVSDIHGNLPFFLALMDRIHLTTHDSLVLVGDMLEKGPHSLKLLHHLMELSKTHTVYPLCGNCDGLVLRFFETDELDRPFFSTYLPQHPESTLLQLARVGGFEQTEDLPKLRRDLRAAFPEEWAWLRAMPTILETEHLVFVHGGVPSLTRMEQLDQWHCMKNDDFLGQGHSFEKWVIVGHWPVTLYNDRLPCAAPLILPERKIISIDGGCVLKADGQLNALILPSEDSCAFDWVGWDGLPTVVALDSQTACTESINIRWGHSELEMITPGPETSLCRHLESGQVLSVLNHYLRHSAGKLWCEDSTNYRLPISPGDRLHLVARTEHGCLCKKDGVSGWYYGRLSDIMD